MENNFIIENIIENEKDERFKQFLWICYKKNYFKNVSNYDDITKRIKKANDKFKTSIVNLPSSLPSLEEQNVEIVTKKIIKETKFPMNLFLKFGLISVVLSQSIFFQVLNFLKK